MKINMVRKPVIILIFFISIVSLIYTSCILFPFEEENIPYTYYFSIKNDTNSDIDVKLIAGEIPNPNARYDEFINTFDEITILYPYLTESAYSNSTIKSQKYESVCSRLPISGLVREDAVLKNLLDKYFSFILTISINGEVIHRIVGWDLPDDEMEKYQIKEKSWGYYYTKEENYYINYGDRSYPKMYGKFWSSEGKHFGGVLIYFVKVTGNSIKFVDFGMEKYSDVIDRFWKKN